MKNINERLALGDSDVYIWCINLDTLALKDPERMLDEVELARAREFPFKEDARRYRAARTLLHTVLSSYIECDPRAIIYEPGPFGKPALNVPSDSGLKFNLSHSGGPAVIVVARRDVGVDVERINSEIPAGEIARSYFA